jgi:hypothetical protein
MTSPAWRKSSWTSDGTQGNCVEVAELPGVRSTEGNPQEVIPVVVRERV